MNALKGIGVGTTFRNILWENDKTINFFDSFFIFPMKVMPKLSYYSLLTIAIRAIHLYSSPDPHTQTTRLGPKTTQPDVGDSWWRILKFKIQNWQVGWWIFA